MDSKFNFVLAHFVQFNLLCPFFFVWGISVVSRVDCL